MNRKKKLENMTEEERLKFLKEEKERELRELEYDQLADTQIPKNAEIKVKRPYRKREVKIKESTEIESIEFRIIEQVNIAFDLIQCSFSFEDPNNQNTLDFIQEALLGQIYLACSKN